MKTAGLIGGTTWLSTLHYYRYINKHVGERLGCHHSAKMLLYTIDFQDIDELMAKDRWDEIANMYVGIAKKLETAGADCLVICANTLHRVADEVEKSVKIPLINIVDATAREIKARGITNIGLLGTKTTMEHDFYKSRLYYKFGINSIIPDEPDRDYVQNVISVLLPSGKIDKSVNAEFRKIIFKMSMRGAQGVILGCTEIPLVVYETDVEIPAFDTTRLHAIAAADFILQ